MFDVRSMENQRHAKGVLASKVKVEETRNSTPNFGRTPEHNNVTWVLIPEVCDEIKITTQKGQKGKTPVIGHKDTSIPTDRDMKKMETKTSVTNLVEGVSLDIILEDLLTETIRDAGLDEMCATDEVKERGD